MNLKTRLTRSLLSTTEKHIAALAEMDLHTVEDLLLYLPRSYEDLSKMDTLSSAPLDAKVTISGTVENVKLVFTKTKKKLVTAKFTDTEGQTADVVWFNQPHIKRMLGDGDEVVMTGKLVENGYKLQLQSPVFEKTTAQKDLVHAGRLVPVYPQHDSINTKWLREKMVLFKKAISTLPETLPEEVMQEEELLSRADAITALHFPDDNAQVQKAMERMAFEEMYNIQREALEQKKQWQGQERDDLRVPMDVELIKSFFASLHFSPTGSQKIAIYEILKDMESTKPMSRLLEGDVGSGKTLVATAVMANTLKTGGQCALMVPTEVLAKQHVVTITRMLLAHHTHLQKSGEKSQLPRVELLTGSMPASAANKVKQGLVDGTVDVVIGTHALLTWNVQFKNLKLVIVDEQHRFGVQQRRTLREKGSPHFLAMTATPIPRTLALTAHGHHDLSVLLEKPGNRAPIHTKVVPPNDRKTVENFIDNQISEGRQVFVICPLIKGSNSEDMMEIKNVQEEHKRLQEGFPHRRIALLHGKLTPSEKEKVMQDFKNKEFDILVSTSVIEVGIDVPNATVIVIEGSERFGLAQLHQFRGRVGRSDHKSYCFLFTTSPEQSRSQRLKAMETHDNGFELAEIDLKLRGPGELFGYRQSGIPEMQVMGLMNPELVVRARRAAEKSLSILS